jgi:ABC-2 type transport system ATP-binding protein
MGEADEGLVPYDGIAETDPPITVDRALPHAPVLALQEPTDQEPSFGTDGDARQVSEDLDPGDSAVWTRGLHKEFESGVGVHEIDLRIPRGSIFGLIGPSGSGKTTTIRLLTGVIAPDSGELSVLGGSPLEFDRVDRSELGYMPQLSVLYPELTLTQNLNFAASLFGVSWRGRRRRVAEMLEFVDLSNARNRLLREASGGMQRRLALAATLIHDPQLLFLDEPTAGVDPVLRRKFWDRFVELRDEGRTLLVTTQYVGEAAYCDMVGVLSRGRLIAVDTPDGLRRQAMGGEVLDVRFENPLSNEQANLIADAAKATDWQPSGPRQYRLVVKDAGDSAADIAAWATANGVGVESVEPHQPPFDDVFVELVTRLDPEEESEESG